MIRFILATFLVLGWAFWEMSGGSGFVPEERPAAAAEVEREAEIVTRASDPDRNSIVVPARLETAVISAPPAAEAEVTAALAEALGQELDPTPDAQQAVVDIDLMRTTDTNVNMRAGPGTGNAVVATLPPRSPVAALETDPATGWIRVRVEGSGEEGWIFGGLLDDG